MSSLLRNGTAFVWLLTPFMPPCAWVMTVATASAAITSPSRRRGNGQKTLHAENLGFRNGFPDAVKTYYRDDQVSEAGNHRFPGLGCLYRPACCSVSFDQHVFGMGKADTQRFFRHPAQLASGLSYSSRYGHMSELSDFFR